MEGKIIHNYYPLFLVAVAAFLSPWLSTRLFRGMIPGVILEILLGYAMGPHGLHMVKTTSEIKFLADFGFSYLMFLSGIELDFDIVFRKNEDSEQAPWIKGMAFFAATYGISLLFSWGLKELGWIHQIFLLSIIISATSVGVVTPTLKAKGWLHIPIGKQSLMYALFADLITLILFTGYVMLHTSGNAFSLLSFLGLLLGFILVYRSVKALHTHKIFHYVESATSEFGLRASMALILVFLAFSQELGIGVTLGAFMAGAVISLLSEKHSIIHQKLNSIGYGFLLPVFFVNVGMNFQINSLKMTSSFWFTLLVLFGIMYLNKLIPIFFFEKKTAWKNRWAMGMIVSSRLSLTIVASQIGKETGILNPGIANGLVLLAILSSVVSPSLFNLILRKEKYEFPGEIKKTILLDQDALPSGWIMEQLEVENSHVFGKRIRKLNIPSDLLILSIIREGERLVPRGYTELEQFDVLQVLGEPVAISLLEEQVT